MNVKTRDPAIDFVKCLAVLLIVNSHLDSFYPDGVRMLATGGAIGNSLFFYCSGYTLAHGRFDSFASWYKRRLSRILPTFLVCTIVCSYILETPWWSTAAAFWFVRCILMHYAALYVIRRRLMDHKLIVWIVSAAVIVGWWLLMERPQDDIYDAAYFLWLHYFPCTLLGLFAASSEHRPSPTRSAAVAAFLVAVYYGVRAIAVGHAELGALQLLAVPAVALLPHYILNAARAPAVPRLMASRAGHVVRFVGGLSLEIYLIHFLVASRGSDLVFPLNLVQVFAVTILAAYLMRALTRFMLQTFNGEEKYDFKAMFR